MDGILFKKINEIMTKIFGSSWRTSFYGLLTVLPQVAGQIQSYIASFGLSAKILNLTSLFFGVLTVLNMKDRQVTGGKYKNDN
jgi:hypothetical protein